ncbi:hypothetical protein BLNAU_20857 [Blattamonas nauphoetae]|uniref:Uncharacterized protein n=1 Tax=Blattamonas nauphoetae TaxID=2049346 RepID=A0ABQ9WZU5_9EUKA|nr:hypothetical protein BLNAU_20857 [Blattamonas nauphoetae]
MAIQCVHALNDQYFSVHHSQPEYAELIDSLIAKLRFRLLSGDTGHLFALAFSFTRLGRHTLQTHRFPFPQLPPYQCASSYKPLDFRNHTENDGQAMADDSSVVENGDNDDTLEYEPIDLDDDDFELEEDVLDEMDDELSNRTIETRYQTQRRE